MKHKYLGLVVLVVLAVLMVTACNTPGTAQQGSAAVRYTNVGQFGIHTRTPVRDFTPLGLVFAENSFRVSGGEVSGEVFTYQSLLKEASAKGADAIINVTIDKKFETYRIGTKTDQQETWYGSALAIKYGDILRTSHTVNNREVAENGTVTTTTNTSDTIYWNTGISGTIQPTSSTSVAEPTVPAAPAAPARRRFLGIF